MLANQPERLSLFLVTSSCCRGHSSCTRSMSGPGTDLWPLKLLPKILLYALSWAQITKKSDNLSG